MVEHSPAARASRLLAALRARPLLLDAAMGTRLLARGLDPARDDPALWSLTRPEAVLAVHRLDVAAGAEALVSNTFGANGVWLARFGLAERAARINRAAVALARQAIGPEGFVLGGLGPTAVERGPGAVAEQGRALLEAGADALLFETYRLDQAERALDATRDLVALPRLVSLATWPDPPGVAAAARRLLDAGASALGCNCQGDLVHLVELAGQLHRAVGLPIVIEPSAGLPGEPPLAPATLARTVPALLDLGVRLLGGCCGTTEAHIAALRAALDAARAASRPPASRGRPG